MWPLSERKMIFACKKEIVTQQWLDNLKAVVNEVNGLQTSRDNILEELGGNIGDAGNGTI